MSKTRYRNTSLYAIGRTVLWHICVYEYTQKARDKRACLIPVATSTACRFKKAILSGSRRLPSRYSSQITLFLNQNMSLFVAKGEVQEIFYIVN
jgi:hypothetical protein